MSTHFVDEGSAANHEVGAQPVESTMDGARDVPAVHVPTPLQDTADSAVPCEESALPVEGAVDGATDSPAVHVPTPLQDTADSAVPCEETLATPDAALAAHRGDDAQNDTPAGVDVQAEPTTPQGMTEGLPPRDAAPVAQLRDDDLDDDPEVNALEAGMDRTAQRHGDEDEEDAPAFFSLRGTPNPPGRFPWEALPQPIARWAEALAVLARGSYVIAATMVLAFIGLVLQPRRDVELWDSPRGLSLFAMIIAPTGAMKSTIFRRLAKPIWEFERGLRRAQAEEARSAKREGRDAPPDDTVMEIITTDPTAASLEKYLPKSRGGFMGLFLDEVAIFAGGYSMQRSTFLGMIGLLSKLYDGDPLTNMRATNSAPVSTALKRFSVLLVGQMGPFTSLLTNQILRQQGFLSRFLVTAPAPEERGKASVEERQAALLTLRSYEAFVEMALNAPPPVVPGSGNDLDPPVLILTPEAEDIIEAFSDEIRALRRTVGDDSVVHELVNKAAELSGRVAGLFSLLADMDASTVGEDAARRAVTLVRYYMGESIRIAIPAENSKHVLVAESIAEWMAKKGLTEVPRTKLQNASIGRKLTVGEFDPALKLLIDSGWIVEARTRARKGGREKRVYRLTRAAMRELKFPGA